MSSIGHLVGYLIGTADMVAIFGTFMGDTQFKKMTVISAAALVFAVGLTSWAVQERVLLSVKSVLPIVSLGVGTDLYVN